MPWGDIPDEANDPNCIRRHGGVDLAACDGGGSGEDAGGDAENDAGGGDGGDLISAGFSQLGVESGWCTANTDSVRSNLTEENGFDLTFADAQQRQENEIRALRDFVSEGVDLIAFSPIVETGWDQVLQEVKHSGIPVVLVDRTVETTVEDPYETWDWPPDRAGHRGEHIGAHPGRADLQPRQGRGGSASAWSSTSSPQWVIGGTLLSGGVGFVLGTGAGVLVYGLIQVLIAREGLDSWWTRVFIGLVLLAFVILQRVISVRRRV